MYHKPWIIFFIIFFLVQVYRMVVKVWSIAEKLFCIQMSAVPLTAAIGGAVGALALSALLVFLLWFCIIRRKNASRTSESGSSDPSTQEGRSVAMDLSMREARRFKVEELAQATKSFTNKSLIGIGKFGEVYKGLLQDGVLVAIKKRPGLPTQELVNEVRYLSSINHRNLVTLLGYSQENNTQFLVYEYVPNGSVSSHLYGAGDKVSGNRLEFRNRLAISIGAAKGLAHLHSLSPRLIHKDFKTANVLVDENFIARVADAGVRNFLGRDDVVVGTSSLDAADQIFLSPEVQEFRRFSEKSDVYAFGVFLLELVSGREASEPSPSSSTQTLVEWMQNIRDYKDIPMMVDERLGGTYTAEGVEEVITLTLRCLNVSSEKRPAMSYVVAELERILDKEVSLTTVMGEGTPTVTLGSQLFKSSN
ncbi:PREDICTED: probable receptor-like protein kinase At2g39360 isoform X1 [Brassica oleracea var. oleracea]|uniref:non-specific serine/threonine protein kinase n=2 Tax=Brassica oleracea var. oleracea TaxID=109376 RepID=A0A0D3E0E4_BRAOL|nr:PREDICTED: probable receptor-like protein kinase At2g39360 isoform X1 [Brassica oleracea var. oleracea]